MAETHKKQQDATAAAATIASRGYFSADNGPPQLLHALYTDASTSSSTSDAAFEYLGDSRREQLADTKVDEVEFKGIRIRDWVIGSNKTHITPLDDMDKCVYMRMCRLVRV